jgi:hypothetical protein
VYSDSVVLVYSSTTLKHALKRLKIVKQVAIILIQTLNIIECLNIWVDLKPSTNSI